jgi:hypothetical protein
MNTPFSTFDQPIDYFNAILVPVILMLALGIPLSIYTGMVATRAFAFLQLRYRAAQWPITLSDTLKRAESPHDAHIEMMHQIHALTFELRALGHTKAAWQVAQCFSNYTGLLCGIFRVTFDGQNVPTLPSVIESSVWNQTRLIFLNSTVNTVNAEIAKLCAIEPNIWPLLTPRLFPNYADNEKRFAGPMPAPAAM